MSSNLDFFVDLGVPKEKPIICYYVGLIRKGIKTTSDLFDEIDVLVIDSVEVIKRNYELASKSIDALASFKTKVFYIDSATKEVFFEYMDMHDAHLAFSITESKYNPCKSFDLIMTESVHILMSLRIATDKSSFNRAVNDVTQFLDFPFSAAFATHPPIIMREGASVDIAFINNTRRAVAHASVLMDNVNEVYSGPFMYNNKIPALFILDPDEERFIVFPLKKNDMHGIEASLNKAHKKIGLSKYTLGKTDKEKVTSSLGSFLHGSYPRNNSMSFLAGAFNRIDVDRSILSEELGGAITVYSSGGNYTKGDAAIFINDRAVLLIKSGNKAHYTYVTNGISTISGTLNGMSLSDASRLSVSVKNDDLDTRIIGPRHVVRDWASNMRNIMLSGEVPVDDNTKNIVVRALLAH